MHTLLPQTDGDGKIRQTLIASVGRHVPGVFLRVNKYTVRQARSILSGVAEPSILFRYRELVEMMQERGGAVDPSKAEQVSPAPLHSDACPQFFALKMSPRKFDVLEFNLKLECGLLNSGGAE
jgi:hypothetical protein